MTEHRRTARSAWRRSKRHRVGMALPAVNLRLRPGKADVLAARWKLDAHFFPNLFENLCDSLDLQGIRIPDGQHRIFMTCLLYTSDAADERSSVDLGGRRIIKKKKKKYAIHYEK